jgi:hypothetical protein
MSAPEMQAGSAQQGSGAFTKDCGCITHEGPHWVHMDEQWRERNRTILRRMEEARAAGNHLGAWLAGQGFAGAEARRLEEKGAMMRRLGIGRIPAEVVDLVRSSHAAYVERRRRELATAVDDRRASVERELAAAAGAYELATRDQRATLRDRIAELQQELSTV